MRRARGGARWPIVACLMVSALGCAVAAGGDGDARLVQGSNVNLGEALQFLREYDTEASAMCFRVSSAQWSYSTNMTDLNKRRMVDEQMLKAKFEKVSWKKAVMFDWTRLPDPMARRQIKLLVTNSRASLSDDKYNEIHHLISEMKDLYAHVRICPYSQTEVLPGTFCNLELEPDVRNIMAFSRNHLELVHTWREWYNKVGPQLKNKFMRYVELANQAARINGFLDAGEDLRYVYEDPDIEHELAETIQKLQPLYKHLFTYVRRKLYEKYSDKVVRMNGPLPAHILGDVWAQDWSNIFDIVIPYPSHAKMDVTGEMLRQGFTPLRIFQMAEEFFTSLGLKPMPPEFWRHSMIEKPNARKVQCTASAWDFCNKVDFRIKQCTEVNMENLITTHHEMTHIQYYLYYADQPFLYREGSHPGFHEGISNAISLSIFNPTHFHRIGLYNNNTGIFEGNINFLMLMGLKKVAYAPFAYIVDEWRYNIFENGVKHLNRAWWELRLRLQGIVPPIPRTENHFDAAAKRHIPADVAYSKYYVALLLEFQVHKAMCVAAGHRGPLHTCDVYRSREAGRVLIDVMKVGRTRHWKEVIRMLTKGHYDKLSADAMLEYFEPLLSWLQTANRGEKVIGWTTSKEDLAMYQAVAYTSNSSTYTSNQVIFVIVFVNIFC